MHAALTVYTVYTRSEIQYNLDSTTDRRVQYSEVRAMPKSKWNLNTIYISERLQESLRPISRCAMTTVVAPMGYGKTTAVSWYLEERAKAEKTREEAVKQAREEGRAEAMAAQQAQEAEAASAEPAAEASAPDAASDDAQNEMVGNAAEKES